MFIGEDGVQVHDKHEIAASFNKYFISIGKKLQKEIHECTSNPLDYLITTHTQVLDNFEPTNCAEVYSIVSNMKNVGSGIDKINADIFKLSYASIIDPLVHMINICMQNGTFPDNMKIAVVKPVFKGGDQNSFNNYRPISILPYISKLLEKK